MVVVRKITAITPICLFSGIQKQTSVSATLPVLASTGLQPESAALPLSPASGCSINSIGLKATAGGGILLVAAGHQRQEEDILS